MEVRKDGENFIVRLEKGDNVISELSFFAVDNNVQGAHVTAIGAFEEAELAYFNEDKGDYEYKTFSGGLEVVSLQGSISILEKDDTPMVHLHAALGDSEYRIVGGHLKEATVSVTLECFISPVKTIMRKIPFGPFTLWKLND